VDCTEGTNAASLSKAVRRPWLVEKWHWEHTHQALSDRPVDVLVFDFDYPSKEGLRLLLAVKRRYPTVPILMITEEHSENLAVWAFRARVWNYFAKPVSIREFNCNLTQLAKVAPRPGMTGREIERPSSTFPAQTVEAGDSGAVVERIAAIIRSEYTSGLRATRLAASFNLSRYQFSRLFKRSFGCSFQSYLTRIRIGAACSLLSKAGPDASVTEISMAVGFQDPSYFARMFRQTVGESPTAYARRVAPKPPMFAPEAGIEEGLRHTDFDALRPEQNVDTVN
jgi:YesN/AraC family two-component response regulator